MPTRLHARFGLEIKIKDNALASALQASAVALQAKDVQLQAKDAEIRRLQADLARAREGTAKPIAVPVPVSSPAARAPAAHESALAQPRAPRQQSATHVSKVDKFSVFCSCFPLFSHILQLKGVSVGGPAWEYSGYIRGPGGADHRAHGFGVCCYLDGQSYEGAHAFTSAGAARAF